MSTILSDQCAKPETGNQKEPPSLVTKETKARGEKWTPKSLFRAPTSFAAEIAYRAIFSGSTCLPNHVDAVLATQKKK